VAAADGIRGDALVMLIDGSRHCGFYHRIKQDVAAIFEESIKRGLD